MSENQESPISLIPTEILIHIFSFIKPIPLVRCRQVCYRWKCIIDIFLCRDDLWKSYCKEDFSQIYQEAYNKRKTKLHWFDIYRSLSLWARLDEAIESRDEFAYASNCFEEIRDFQLLQDDIIGVHCRESITYYDLHTMKLFEVIRGRYLKYMENETTFAMLGSDLNLYVTCRNKTRAVFQSVKTFILLEKEVFFVTITNVVYRCDLHEEELEGVELVQMDTVVCIGYTTQLNILTFVRDIYSLYGKEKKYRCTLGPSTNLMHEFNKYKLLENLDWRVYYQWMYLLNHSVPDSPLREIIIIKTYGNLVFVGTNRGVVRIYYSPYINEQFDIFNSEPLKQYNFMERFDCPVLSLCPIMQIDVVEAQDSHLLFIAMPKKISIITFSHNFYRNELQSFTEESEVEILK